MNNHHSSCPGIPERCEHSQALISQVLEGIPNPALIDAARQELSRCLPCVQEIDFQVRFKLAMCQQATEHAPPSLQLRITEALGRVDLDVGIEDL
ncbi:MAG: hypothetical protein AAF480_17060 [Actinomycetota bacterium]